VRAVRRRGRRGRGHGDGAGRGDRRGAGGLGLGAGAARNALVIGAEKLSDFTDWTDRSTCIIFGDGAGAAVVTAAAEGDGLTDGQVIGHVSTRQGPVPVTAHAAGVLTEWLAHHDDPVAPGQPLARIGGPVQ
jgi:hypothetical protein